MPKVHLYRGDVVEHEFDPGERDWRIGRGTANDVVLTDPTRSVSRFQAEIRREQGQWWILDLGSQNGSWIDGRRIQREPLTDGTTVLFGDYRLVFGDVSPSPQPAVVPAQDAPIVNTIVMTASIVAGIQRAARPAPVTAAPSETRTDGIPPVAKASGGIVLWLVRLPRPVLFGGFVVVTLIVMAGAMMVRPAIAPRAAASSTPARPAATRPTDPNAAVIEEHLKEARSLAAAGDCPAAIRDHLARLLLIDPTHRAASELKVRCEEQIRAAATPALPPAPTGTASQPMASAAATGGGAKPVDAASLKGRGAASVNAGKGSVDDGNMSAIRAALARQDFVAARAAGMAALKKVPHDLQVKALLAEADAGLQRMAARELDAGNRSEQTGDVEEAMRAYERARQLAPGVDGLSDAMARVSQRMATDGEAAYSRARQLHSLGRLPEAVASYERAARLLPTGDARRAEALARVAELKGKP